MDDLHHRPRWVYTDATSAVDFHMAIPQRAWSVGTGSVGGSDVSAAGVPAAFQIRRDSLWRLTLRFREREWGNVERLIAHLQGGGSVTFYPDRLLSASQTVYGVAPAMGEEVIPRPSDEPSVQEIDITVRPTTAVVVRRPYYGRALWRWSAGDDARGITFTRAGTVLSTYRGYDRLTKTAGANELRTDWRMVNGVLQPFTLLEVPRRNLFTRALEFDHADWIKAEATVTPNVGLGGGGAMTSDKLIPSTNNTAHSIRQAVTGTASAPFAVSFEVQAAGYDRVAIVIDDAADGTFRAQAVFDLTAGTLLSSGVGSGGGTVVWPEIASLGGGRYYIALSGLVGSAATAIRGLLYVVQPGGTNPFTTFAGDGTSGVLLWGGQFEDNAREPSSLIPNVATADLRGAEAFSDVFPYTPTQLAAMPGGGATLYGDAIEGLFPPFANEGATSPRLAHIGAADNTSPRLFVGRINATDDYQLGWNNGTSQVTSTVSAGLSPTRLSRIQWAAQFYADGAVQLHMRKDGGSDVSGAKSAANALVSAWSDDLIHLGGVGVLGRGIQWYRDAIWLPGILGIAECEREARAA